MKYYVILYYFPWSNIFVLLYFYSNQLFRTQTAKSSKISPYNGIVKGTIFWDMLMTKIPNCCSYMEI
jgi:hypothetical protein